MSEQLYDVIVYERATRRVISITGRGLHRDDGFHNAEKQLKAVLTRIDVYHAAIIVPTDSCVLGDILEPESL